MPEHRETHITLTERDGNTRIVFNSDGPIDFAFNWEPKTFTDPRVKELEAIVESQRVEITKEIHAHHETRTALADAKKAIRNGKAGTKSGRRR